MIRVNRILVIASLLLSGASLLFAAPPPSPAQSEHFKGCIGGFYVKGEKVVKYSYGVDVIKPFERTVYLEIEFENPENKENPFVVPFVLNPDNPKVVVESPPIKGLRRGIDYSIVIWVYENEKKGKLIARHEDKLRSAFDDRMLSDEIQRLRQKR